MAYIYRGIGSVFDILFGQNGTPEEAQAEQVVASLESQSHASQHSIPNLQSNLSSPRQPHLSSPTSTVTFSHPEYECVDSLSEPDP
jgi:hypothetical protein